jgi:hypothetical protein
MQSSAHAPRTLRLGDILVEQGVISKEQLGESLEYQKDTGARLGEALIDLGYVTPEKLQQILSWQSLYGLDALAEIIPDPSAVGLLTERFCRVRRVLPLEFDSLGGLVLAMADPADIVTGVTSSSVSPRSPR